VGARPRFIEQLIVRNQPACVLHQAMQNAERFGCQSNASILAVVLPPPQALIIHIKPELEESFHDASR